MKPKKAIAENDDIEVISQFRFYATRALEEGYDVVLVRRKGFQIYSESDRPQCLGVMTGYEVIYSVKEDMRTGSLIWEWTCVDMPYRSFIENMSEMESCPGKRLSACFLSREDLICAKEKLPDEFADDSFSRDCYYTTEPILPLMPSVEPGTACFKSLLQEFDALRQIQMKAGE